MSWVYILYQIAIWVTGLAFAGAVVFLIYSIYQQFKNFKKEAADKKKLAYLSFVIAGIILLIILRVFFSQQLTNIYNHLMGVEKIISGV